MQLRDYQETAIEDIYGSFRKGNKNVMLQLPTGGGKTIVTAKICKDGYQNGRRVLVLAHREELVKQAAAKIEQAIGSPVVGIIKSGIVPDYNLPVQVASVQTIVKRLAAIDNFHLIICDEAHHSTANTYRAIYDRFHAAKLLGVTATPIRLNGKGFKDLFDDLVTSLTTQQLIEMGHLSKFKLFAYEKQMKFDGVSKKLGEYSQAEIAEMNDPTELAGDVVASYERYAKGSQCLVFATSVEHSIAIADAYNDRGIKAIHLDGTTPSSERSQALADFIDKKVQVISNCSLFGEGLDIPALETVQIARRTASVGLHLQMLGRVLRVAEGKEHAIIIDHTDNWKRLGLPTKPRRWSLKGVKDDKPQELEVDEETDEVIEVIIDDDEKLSTLPIVNDYLHLNEILTPTNEVEMWEYEFRQLVHTLEQRGYKPSWLVYRLQEIEPPLAIWRMAAKYCGYHWKFADHKFADQQNKSQQVLELV